MSQEPGVESKIPERIGRYQVKGILGKGGMSTVYTCYDPRVERNVAIKILPRAVLHDETFRSRFKREAKTIAGLEHPFIVPIHDFGEDNSQPYLVMRLMAGGSLSEKLSRTVLTPEEIGEVVRRLSRALNAAHQKGVVHRDLKPGNVLFDSYGNAFLSDFGIARITQGTQPSLTRTGGAVGTPGYMSPEQIQGRPVDGRSDIYALGVLIFEMLSGRKPFHADTPAMVIVKQMTETVPNICDLIPDLPPAYDDLIRSLTHPERDKRPATAVIAFEMLAEILQRQQHNAAATPWRDPTPPPPSTRLIDRLTEPEQTPGEREPLRYHDLLPPIIPELLSEPETPPAAAVPIPAEPTVTTSFACPHCHGTITLAEGHNQVICPHCHRSIKVAGHLCPYCDTYHAQETGFCNNCGAVMTRVCPSCRTPNWAGVETCETCGSGLDIFESLRLHDKRIVANQREQRLHEIRHYKEAEEEASQRRMQQLRGDPETLRLRKRRRKLFNRLALVLIFVILVALAVYVGLNLNLF